MRKLQLTNGVTLLILFLSLPIMLFITLINEQKINGTIIITGGNDMTNLIPRALQINDPSLFSKDWFFNNYMGKAYPQTGIYVYAWMIKHAAVSLIMGVMIIVLTLICILRQIRKELNNTLLFHDKLNIFLCILCIIETFIFYIYSPSKTMLIFFTMTTMFFASVIFYLFLNSDILTIKSKFSFQLSQLARWLVSVESQWLPVRNIKVITASIIMLFLNKTKKGENMRCPRCNQEVPTADSAFYARFVECMACQIYGVGQRWL